MRAGIQDAPGAARRFHQIARPSRTVSANGFSDIDVLAQATERQHSRDGVPVDRVWRSGRHPVLSFPSSAAKVFDRLRLAGGKILRGARGVSVEHVARSGERCVRCA